MSLAPEGYEVLFCYLPREAKRHLQIRAVYAGIHVAEYVRRLVTRDMVEHATAPHVCTCEPVTTAGGSRVGRRRNPDCTEHGDR
jgi:hypothetical protein